MSEPWNYPDVELLSDCCSAAPTDEVIDGEGRCSKCKEYCSFTAEDETNIEYET